MLKNLELTTEELITLRTLVNMSLEDSIVLDKAYPSSYEDDIEKLTVLLNKLNNLL